MNAEEDVQYLRLILSGLDPTQGVMLLPPIFFTSTPNSRLYILMQCVSVTPQPRHQRQRILDSLAYTALLI